MRRHHRTPFIDLRRRELLLALSGTLVAGQAPAQSLLTGSEKRPLPNCTVTPEQTEGPYFIDTRLDRSDIHTDLSDKSAKPGVPLILQLRVHAVHNMYTARRCHCGCLALRCRRRVFRYRNEELKLPARIPDHRQQRQSPIPDHLSRTISGTDRTYPFQSTRPKPYWNCP